ncbi:aspartate kinase [Hymenobacter daecheongensis DSM 21074]|uniref:Aspartokinase n=1 Tax=Hymenobacter daecheongensis DSM 21074 TaxID=1121955 RepID=A0A1M6E5J4_9BACT|nr:aspartate kinase [Hymenobacter daecheongensis]SHI80776.1 aspartate kinase [Hymenobacter daecheongensis DSM 21074]
MQQQHALKVYKFGGASVKDAAAIRNLVEIVRGHAADSQLLIVVSAMGKTTNALEDIFQRAHAGTAYAEPLAVLQAFHEQVAQELFADETPPAAVASAPATPTLDHLFAQLHGQLARVVPHDDYDRQYDQIVSFGELLATAVVAWALQAQWLDCRPLLRTDATWREGRLDWPLTEQQVLATVPPLLLRGPVVTQGFVGGTADGVTTTLGREGSDYTAAIFAYCLQAESVTIWKDVAGLLNADPKFFADPVRYPEISYQETIEMAYYGASVIHPKTIKPLAVRRIPLFVKSFLDPAAEGTRIGDCRHGLLAPAFIRKNGQCLISFESKDLTFISEENLEVIFGALAQARLKINMMQNSAISFSVCTDFGAYRLDKLLDQLRDQFTIHYNTGLELYTIKNYDAASIGRLTAGREVLLEQRTRQTLQVVCRGGSEFIR